MNQRVVTGLLTAGCIALAGAGYMTYKNQDRTAPEIKVDQNEKIAYTEGEDYGKLLKGVTAQDDKDGDLTSEVFVEKVVLKKRRQKRPCRMQRQQTSIAQTSRVRLCSRTAHVRQ